MRLGVPCERPDQALVAATPQTVERLVRLGYDVLVERGAGRAARFLDSAYEEAGARLTDDAEVWGCELVLGVDAPAAAYSMNTGSVRVTERYLADGVTPASEAAARDHVRALLDRAGAVVDLGSTRELVGLAGTITTVTAHALGLESFEPEAIDGARLDVGTALASCEAIVHSTAAERESWGYLRPGRRDVIAAGALVWSEVIARVAEATAAHGHRLTHTVTSLHDILDGIALSLVRPVGDPADGSR